MARRKRRGGRVTPRTHRSVWPESEPGLPPLDGIVQALEGFEGIGDAPPLAVELQISTFLGQLGAGEVPDPHDDEPDHEELLHGIVEVCLLYLEERVPRVVLDFLWVLDAFDLPWLQLPLRERLEAAETPSRPAWAMDVGRAEVGAAHVTRHETRDGIDVSITARHRSAPRDHVIAVYIDRTLGGLATDILVHPDADEYLRLSRDEPGMTVEEIPLEVARTTVDAAVDATFDVGVPPAVSDSFATSIELLEHVLRKLPDGGSPLSEPEPVVTEAPEALADRFLESLTGMGHRRDRDTLVELLGFVRDELGGDPLRWSPPVVQVILSAWLPVVDLDDEVVARVPSLVRAVLPWAHREQGWGDRYLSTALEIVDRIESGDDELTAEARGGVEILERALAEGVDLDDEAALDAFLDRYLGDEDAGS